MEAFQGNMWIKKCTSGALTAAIIAGASMGQINSSSAAAQAPSAEEYLISGKLAEGEQALTTYLGRGVNNDEARFGLGCYNSFKLSSICRRIYTSMESVIQAWTAPFARSGR